MRLLFKDRVLKQLVKIPRKDRKKVEKKLSELQKNPQAGKELQGEFSGMRSLRAWPLRIIYIFNPKTQTIEINVIDYRGQIYK